MLPEEIYSAHCGNNRHALATAAGVCLVWIPKHKLLVQQGGFIVHFAAKEEQDRLCLNQYGHTIIFDDLIERFGAR